MKFHVVAEYPKDFDAILVALPEPHNGKLEVDKGFEKQLGIPASEELIKRKFKGKTGEAVTLKAGKDFGGDYVIFAGIGKDADRTPDDTRKAAAAGLAQLRSLHGQKLVMWFPPFDGSGDLVELIVEGLLLANYSFDRYKASDDDKPEALGVYLIVEPQVHDEIEAAVERGRSIADATNLARDLVNEPPSVMTPSKLAEEATRIAAEGKGLTVEVKGRAELESLGFEPTLAVSRASSEEPKFIKLEYAPAGAKRHVVLVGKGITYDSGGVNLKPSKGGALEDMKMDMAGAGAVLSTVSALPKLGIPVKVTAYVAAAENMIGGRAYKPGDVVKAYNGKTIEVLNTDAEGRLTLADVLSYTERHDKPDVIIDLATLTATEVSLGTDYAAVFGDDDVAKALFEAGTSVGEPTWQLPLPDSYQDTVKSQIADVRNIGTDRGYSINGAVFLRNFVTKKTPWVHVDIGSPASSEKEKGYLKRGATGFGVRLLIEYLKRLA